MRMLFIRPIFASHTALLRSFYNVRETMRKMSKIAVCQLTSTNNKDANLQTFESLVQRVTKEAQVEFIFFPEAVDYVALSTKSSVEMAEDLEGPTMQQYKKCAQDHNVWLSIGGFHEINKEDNNKIFNSHVIINNKGEIVDVYRKLHLFNVDLPEQNVHLHESSYVTSGSSIASPIPTPIGSLGLSICYDLRFPEVSTCLRKMGADILTYPSAFTTTTGAAHWECLLRARAIENQCYVIAAAQYGVHNEKRQSFGNSIVIDPWGTIITQLETFGPNKPETDVNFGIATIDLNQLNKIRKEMPVLEHRRNDIYSLNAVQPKTYHIDNFNYMFADKIIPASTVFYKSAHSFAFTNIRCVVPGHVLVGTLRVAKRLCDLSSEEVADLFQTVVRVEKVMEQVYGTTSSTVCIQDGALSGQTVPHVHVHILPRKERDFDRNDDIYEELARHDRDSNTDPIRDISEMAHEADSLRKLFE